MAGEWAIVVAGVGAAAVTVGVPGVVQLWREARAQKATEAAALDLEYTERLLAQRALAQEILEAAAFYGSGASHGSAERNWELLKVLHRGELEFPQELALVTTQWVDELVPSDANFFTVTRKNLPRFREMVKSQLGNKALKPN